MFGRCIIQYWNGMGQLCYGMGPRCSKPHDEMDNSHSSNNYNNRRRTSSTSLDQQEQDRRRQRERQRQRAFRRDYRRKEIDGYQDDLGEYSDHDHSNGYSNDENIDRDQESTMAYHNHRNDDTSRIKGAEERDRLISEAVALCAPAATATNGRGGKGGIGSRPHGSMHRVGSLVMKRSSRRNQTQMCRASDYSHVHLAALNNMLGGDPSNTSGINGLPLGTVGLQNLGNTCFLNSSIQCLSATIPLTDYFLGYDYRSEINKNNFLGTGGKLVTAYADLLKEMWLGRKAIIRPTAFKRQLAKFSPQFGGTSQHDAQELLAYLLDGIHEDLNRVKKKPYIEDRDCDGTSDETDAIEAWKNYLRRDKSLVVDLFQGQLRNTCQCHACGHRNIRFEPFMYLSLPISSSCRSIEDCLDLYLAQDELRGENRWYCEKCKRHRDATKKTDIWILPPILIIHLKRFTFDDYGHGRKNKVPIQFPLEKWDFSNILRGGPAQEGSCNYDLYAISNHMGSLGSGHYTAYSLNRFDDNWYESNDSVARPVSRATVADRSAAAAYVLFYNRSSEVQTIPLNGGAESTVHSNGTASAGSIGQRYTMIRRQSVSRPDLWPHQIKKQMQRHSQKARKAELERSHQGDSFRQFQRPSRRDFSGRDFSSSIQFDEHM